PCHPRASSKPASSFLCLYPAKSRRVHRRTGRRCRRARSDAGWGDSTGAARSDLAEQFRAAGGFPAHEVAHPPPLPAPAAERQPRHPPVQANGEPNAEVREVRPARLALPLLRLLALPELLAVADEVVVPAARATANRPAAVVLQPEH